MSDEPSLRATIEAASELGLQLDPGAWFDRAEIEAKRLSQTALQGAALFAYGVSQDEGVKWSR